MFIYVPIVILLGKLMNKSLHKIDYFFTNLEIILRIIYNYVFQI